MSALLSLPIKNIFLVEGHDHRSLSVDVLTGLVMQTLNEAHIQAVLHPKDHLSTTIDNKTSNNTNVHVYAGHGINQSIKAAVKMASIEGHQSILCCGSNFHMAQARQAIGLLEDLDAFDMQESRGKPTPSRVQ